MASEAAEAEALRHQVASGMGWSLLNSVAGRFVTVAVGLVLARLLVPEEYGAFAVAFVVLAVAQSLNELGVSVVIVRWPGEVARVARTATTLAVAMSAVLYISIFVMAPTVADAINAPGAVTVIRVLALGVVVDGISSIPNALMARMFMQKQRAIADGVALVPASVLSIALAAAGHGAESLAWGTLAGNVTSTVLVLLLAPSRPVPGWHRDDARELLKIGLPLAGTSLALLATLNVDYVVVGRLLGTASLGYYLLAFNLSSWPANLLSVAVRRVAIPGFARVMDDREALARSFGRALHLLSALAFAAGVLLSGLAVPVVAVVYGSRWAPAARTLELLALLGALRVIYDLAYDLLAALGRTRVLLAVQIAWFVSLLVALPIGANANGIRGVGVAHCIVAICVVGPAYVVGLARAGIGVRVVASALAWPVVASVLAAAVVVFGRSLGWPPAAEMFGLGAVGGLVFAAVLAITAENRHALRATIERRRTTHVAAGE